MKNIIIVLLTSILFISTCKKDDHSDAYAQIREIAWNSLSTQEKSTVTIDWKKAKVELSTYNGESAYMVIFNTRDDELLGPITVYVDPLIRVVLGQGFRD
ncbi:MAG TPA: hypothetical protein VIH57_04535 [Bacteroidales bacterium]